MPFLRACILHPREREPGSLVSTKPGLPIVARTLGEAITVAAEYFKVRIVPHDPPKWFRVYGTRQDVTEYTLVDIHIKRDGQEICPKQDLEYLLMESDIVSIGALAC
jgi:hypothetical protein